MLRFNGYVLLSFYFLSWAWRWAMDTQLSQLASELELVLWREDVFSWLLVTTHTLGVYGHNRIYIHTFSWRALRYNWKSLKKDTLPIARPVRVPVMGHPTLNQIWRLQSAQSAMGRKSYQYHIHAGRKRANHRLYGGPHVNKDRPR